MKKAAYVLLVLLVMMVAGGIGYRLVAGHPDALRKQVLEQCLPNQRLQDNPAPCAQVNLSGGYVIYKDKHGPLQYLLMPGYRINGIESPLLTEPGTHIFFWTDYERRIF